MHKWYNKDRKQYMKNCICDRVIKIEGTDKKSSKSASLKSHHWAIRAQEILLIKQQERNSNSGNVMSSTSPQQSKGCIHVLFTTVTSSIMVISIILLFLIISLIQFTLIEYN